MSSMIKKGINRLITMKPHKKLKHHIGRLHTTGLAAVLLFLLVSVLESQEAKTSSTDNKPPPQSGQPTNSPVVKQQAVPTATATNASVQTKIKPPAKELSGAEIYSMHCARCHPERYPNERTSAQWKTIALHMRVRANLPAEHTKKVLKYLQDNSGY